MRGSWKSRQAFEKIIVMFCVKKKSCCFLSMINDLNSKGHDLSEFWLVALPLEFLVQPYASNLALTYERQDTIFQDCTRLASLLGGFSELLERQVRRHESRDRISIVSENRLERGCWHHVLRLHWA